MTKNNKLTLRLSLITPLVNLVPPLSGVAETNSYEQDKLSVPQVIYIYVENKNKHEKQQ